MPAFETIPAEDNSLLDKPKASLRRVIVAAAALSFVLGAVAATAVGSTSTTAGAMDLHRHGSKTKIENAHITLISSGKCLTVNDEQAVNSEDNFKLAKCGTGDGKGHHSKQRFNYEYKSGSGGIQYRDGEKGWNLLSIDFGGCRDHQNDCDLILWYAADAEYENAENIHWDPVTKQIKSHNDEGNELCMTAVERLFLDGSETEVLWKPCGMGSSAWEVWTSASQKWQIGDATEPPSDDEPTSEPTPSLCAVKNCVAPGACLLIGYKDGEPLWNKFSCEVNPGHFTDASVCERHMGIWCDAPP